MASLSFYLLVTLSLLQITYGADPLYHFCSSSQNFTSNSPYESNLNKLFGSLYIQTPSTGFGSGTMGRRPYKTYGLALCRGDVSADDCKTCVADAGREIRNLCPYNKASIIWYDNCLLKYSDKDFFGQIDNSNKFYMWNVQEVNNGVSFNKQTKELLGQLANKAYRTTERYATGETKTEEYGTLYGLVQCTRDLSSAVCKKCLDGIIGELPNCCDAKEGGRVVSGSCNFRYEIYPFVNVN